MSDNDTNKKDTSQDARAAAQPERGPRRGRRTREDGAGRRRGGGRREGRERSEFDQKTLFLRRVARVTGGGRRFSFSAVLVVGDRKGRVGVGVGKAGDTALSIEKALKDAKKNMIRVKLTETGSISHDVRAKESSGIVEIRPAPERGIIAGSAVKVVLELAGVKDVTAKILSPSKNKLPIARATIKALSQLKG